MNLGITGAHPARHDSAGRDAAGRGPVHGEAPSVSPSGVLVGVSELSGLRHLEALPEGLPSLRVLVVDDDAPVRLSLIHIFSAMQSR